ncbi:hypothetical protein [Carboxylicivirga linearis]|uniref:Phage protein D n=1 Tax=Carboxylicivirga linearis TaxID=1628157 RepID=A0ABS5JY17_9BACT|nr:hypothetical protein [Carboxylicivirga linearis]MBS2099191.1 hypothetical protein [Carboxylicivirga linearis]
MSTYAQYGEIVFPANEGRQGFRIRRFSECTIESSWQSLTDTAEIITPRKVKDFNRMKVSEWFREGDPVEIWLGYDGNLELEFSGYVSKVPAGIPLVISCEDEMYKLKRQTVSVSKQNCTLKELLTAIAPGYIVVCDDSQLLGNVRFSNMASSQILDELKKQGIHSWFEGKELHAFSKSKNELDPVDIQLERTASESLKQKAIEDTMVIISLIRKKGKKLKVEYGDKGAGKRLTKELSGIEISEDEMRREAKKIYDEAKQPGLDGDVTLFGVPRVQHGMKMNLNSVLYPEKDGIYYIDAVTKTYLPGEYRQACKLGDKAV